MHDDDTQLISAYLDGELAEQERLQFEQRLVVDQTFAQLYKEYERNNQALKDAFADIASDPVPSALADLLDLNQAGKGIASKSLSESGSPVNPGRDRKGGGNVIDRSSVSWWTSRPLQIAAAVSTFAIGLSLMWSSSENPLTPQNLTAAIESHLESTPSGQLQVLDKEGEVSINVLLSFEHNDGRFCREYSLQAPQQDLFAIACKSESGWQTEIEHTVERDIASQSSDTQYQPANAADIPALNQYVDNYAKSDAFSSTRELTFLENGWKK